MKIHACAQQFKFTNQQSFTRNNKKKNLYVILHIFSNNSSERFLRLPHDIHRVHIHSYSTVAFSPFWAKVVFHHYFDLQPKKPPKILFPNGLKYEQFIFEYSELSL